MTDAKKAAAAAPKAPLHYSSDEEKNSYRAYYKALGAVPSMLDAAGPLRLAQPRRCWVFPDGSRLIDDFAR